MSISNSQLSITRLAFIAAFIVFSTASAYAQSEQQASSRRAKSPVNQLVTPSSTTIVKSTLPSKMSVPATQPAGANENYAEARKRLPAGVTQKLTDDRPTSLNRQAIGSAQTIAPPTPLNTIATPTIAKVSANGSSRRSHRIPSEALSVLAPNQNAFQPASAQQSTSAQATSAQATASSSSNNVGKVVKNSTNRSIPDNRIGDQKTDPLVEADQTEQSQPSLASTQQVSSKQSVSRDEVQPQPPKAHIAKSLEPIRRAKPLPKLANPEQFRAASSPRKFHREFREVPPGPSGAETPMYGRRIPTGFGGQDQDEPSWLDNLPRPTLTPGLRGMAFQRASANRQSDPLLNFAQTAEVAMDFRMDSSSHVKTWRSPNLSHRPIYFEDENLERYGNGHPTLQPFISGSKFFATAIFLPYHVGAQPPNECVYEMGYFRPGDCNPAYKKNRELSRRGLFNQLMTFGLVFGGL